MEETKLLRDEVHNLNNSLIKHQANTVVFSDFLIVREKTFRTEQQLSQLGDYMTTTQKLLESQTLLGGRLGSLEVSCTAWGDDMVVLKKGWQNLESEWIQIMQCYAWCDLYGYYMTGSVLQCDGKLSLITEQVKAMDNRVQKQENSLTRDLSSVKDLAGSLSK